MINQGLHFSLYKKILEGEISPPSLPDVSLRIRRAMTNPDYGINDLIPLLQSDPGLVGQLMQISDSPIYHCNKPPKNLRSALNRLGSQACNNIVFTYSIKNLFLSPEPKLKAYLRDAWQSCLLNAAIASVLASRTRHLEPDQALLGGLLQEVGKMLFLLHLKDRPELLESKTLVQSSTENACADIGVVLLKIWHMDEAFITMTRERSHWDYRGVPYDLSSLGVLTHYLHRHLLQRLGSANKHLAELPELTDLPCFKHSTFNSHTSADSLLDSILDDVEIIITMLGGKMPT